MSFTVWFTGLSGAGKTTLSRAVYVEIRRRGLRAEWLDGDILRTNFSSELGYSKKDRDTNVRRIGFVSHLLNKNDVAAVVAAIAPYEEARRQNRDLLGQYVEVYCKCPLDVLRERDPKGLYKLADAGKIPYFTGVSDPYEPPVDPDIVVETSVTAPSLCAASVVDHLVDAGLLSDGAGCLDPECVIREDAEWRERLTGLGYAK